MYANSKKDVPDLCPDSDIYHNYYVMTNQQKRPVRLAKTQISLGIRPDWS